MPLQKLPLCAVMRSVVFCVWPVSRNRQFKYVAVRFFHAKVCANWIKSNSVRQNHKNRKISIILNTRLRPTTALHGDQHSPMFAFNIIANAHVSPAHEWASAAREAIVSFRIDRKFHNTFNGGVDDGLSTRIKIQQQIMWEIIIIVCGVRRTSKYTTSRTTDSLLKSYTRFFARLVSIIISFSPSLKLSIEWREWHVSSFGICYLHCNRYDKLNDWRRHNFRISRQIQIDRHLVDGRRRPTFDFWFCQF